jgi:hypothetical protein
MTSSYQPLSLSQAVPGMVLSEDLHDAQGNILLPYGSTLTDAILRSLQRRGVKMLSVVADASPVIDQAAQRDYHRARLARLFRKCNDDQGCRVLRNLMTQYRLGEKS